MCLLRHSFLSVRHEPTFGSLKGSPFLQQMALGQDSSSLWLTSWPLGVLRVSLPTDGPDPAATTVTFSSLVSSWRGQLARVPQLGKEQETLMISPFSLFPLLNPPYPTPFFFPVPWTQESGRRASSWAEDWRLITSSWQRTQILVLFQFLAGDVCKPTIFAPLSCLFPPLLSTWHSFLSLKTWDVFIYSISTWIWSSVSL